MNHVVESVNAHRLNSKSSWWLDLLFGGLPLLTLLPMLVHEFELLWWRPGMRFFPIPIFLVACVAMWHWRLKASHETRRILIARGLFLASVLLYGVSMWRFSPWLAHGSLVLLFASWALQRFGDVAWPRVLGWTALMATSMRLPGELDGQLQSWLVGQSTAALGRILDAAAFPFLIQADQFSMQGLEFSISECCNHYYSLHALGSAVVVLLLFNHRSLLVAFISILTLPVWIATQYLLQLLSLVMLKHFADRDASQGLDHALVMLAMFGCVWLSSWLTTWFFARILQPVPAADSEFEPEFLLLNSILCWPQRDPFFGVAVQAAPPAEAEVRTKRLAGISRIVQQVCVLGCLGMLGLGLLATQRWVYAGVGSSTLRLPTINSQRFAATEWRDSLPETLGSWQGRKVSFEVQREQGARRAVIKWQLAWQGQILELNITLPFINRPSLASKYEAKGWRILTEQSKQVALPAAKAADAESTEAGVNQLAPAEALGSKQIWTEVSIVNELGGRATALVAYHALDGQANSHDLKAAELNGAPTKANPLANPLAYQIVLLCESGEELKKAELNELYAGFQSVNEQIRKEVEPQLRLLLGGEK